jgi:collagen type VII alpha
MLVLDTINKSITVAMSGAPATTNPDFVTAYSDDNGTTFVEGSSDGALNGTSQVTLVSAPAASTRRLIKSIFIENKDTAPVTLTITLNNSSTLRTIAKVTLAVGDTWSTDGVTDTNGNFKGVGVSGISGFSGFSGISGFSGAQGTSGISGYSGYSGSGISGYSGTSGYSGYSGSGGVSTGKSIAMALIFGF